MRRLLLVCGALLLISAATASAGGINLSWNDCGVYGGSNKSFACDTNTLTDAVLVASYAPTYGSFNFIDAWAMVDLVSSSATLPLWWQFKNVGACRLPALSSDLTFASGTWSCPTLWGGLAAGGITAVNYYGNPRAYAPNRAHIDLIMAVATENAVTPTSPNEYLVFQLRISGIRTVGYGCTGCEDPVCIVLNEIRFDGPITNGTHPTLRVQNPIQRNWVTWQGGAVAAGCPAATPARNQTWGSLKAMYH